MQLKLNRIAPKQFVMIFSILNVISGFIMGTIVAIASAVAPDQGFGGAGPWSILLFPVLNGIFGVLTGVFLTGAYNLLSKYFGGIVLEYEEITDK